MARNDEGGGNYSRVSSRSFRDRWREPWPIKAAAELRKTAAGERARPLRPSGLQGDQGARGEGLSRTTGTDCIYNYPLSGRRGVWGGGRGVGEASTGTQKPWWKVEKEDFANGVRLTDAGPSSASVIVAKATWRFLLNRV